MGPAEKIYWDWKNGFCDLLSLLRALDEKICSESLSFKELAQINLQRALRWHKDGIEEWNEAEWTNAMAGEAGEACNASKKLRRLINGMQQADGDTPAPKSLYEARRKVLKEVGDTVIYADLVCQRVNGTMEEAVKLAFNQVSEREGFPERLAA